jgi:hypothetical protein
MTCRSYPASFVISKHVGAEVMLRQRKKSVVVLCWNHWNNASDVEVNSSSNETQ